MKINNVQFLLLTFRMFSCQKLNHRYTVFMFNSERNKGNFNFLFLVQFVMHSSNTVHH